MINRINFLTTLKALTFQQIACLVLGFILICAVPFAGGLAQNWFIPLAEGYRISYFYLAEILIFGIGIFLFPICLHGKEERFLFFSLVAIVISRIISLLFASKMQLSQFISIARYIEVALSIYVILNLVTDRKNFNFFAAGLFLGALLESVGNVIIFFNTVADSRGILIGIPSYQIQILVVITCVLLFTSTRKWGYAIPISIMLWGILSTKTRAAYLQFFMSMGLVLWWGWRKAILKKMIPIIAFSILFLSAISYNPPPSPDKMETARRYRIEEVSSEHGTIRWRFYLWDKSLGAFFLHPVSGIGSGGFGRQFNELPQVFNIKIEDYRKNVVLTSHNTVLGILAETGIIGFLAYLLWFIALTKIIIKTQKVNSNDSIAVAASFMLIIFLISDFWSQNSFYPNSSFFIAIILGRLRYCDVTRK
jgi:O-antigen ligase